VEGNPAPQELDLQHGVQQQRRQQQEGGHRGSKSQALDDWVLIASLACAGKRTVNTGLMVCR
jgi:hypothetical protein